MNRAGSRCLSVTEVPTMITTSALLFLWEPWLITRTCLIFPFVFFLQDDKLILDAPSSKPTSTRLRRDSTNGSLELTVNTVFYQSSTCAPGICSAVTAVFRWFPGEVRLRQVGRGFCVLPRNGRPQSRHHHPRRARADAALHRRVRLLLQVGVKRPDGSAARRLVLFLICVSFCSGAGGRVSRRSGSTRR